MLRKVKRYLKDPRYAFGCDMINTHPKILDDKTYIMTMWQLNMGSKLDLTYPVTFNEKLQWLKLYDRNPLYPTLVDKLKVKEYVSNVVGEDIIIPTLATYKSAQEIDLQKLPNQFVLKCNHDSGSVVICKDKSSFDLSKAQSFLGNCLKRNFYWDAREWAYKNVEPFIFAEQYIQDDYFNDLVTYKFLCFDGEPKVVYSTVKNDDIWENYYDIDFNQLPISRGRRTTEKPLEKPILFERMVDVARKLSYGIPHVRIDLYTSNNTVYFSEFTFYDWAGLVPFDDIKWDKEVGAMIVLPKKK